MKNLITCFQAFCLGAIVMAYVADYNRNQLPTALLFLTISIVFRLIGSKNV